MLSGKQTLYFDIFYSFEGLFIESAAIIFARRNINFIIQEKVKAQFASKAFDYTYLQHISLCHILEEVLPNRFEMIIT